MSLWRVSGALCGGAVSCDVFFVLCCGFSGVTCALVKWVRRIVGQCGGVGVQ